MPTPPPTTAPLLQVNQLAHRFGEQQVLRNINLQLAAGEVLCLAGPSGCGKSTLLRLIAGLETLQQGSIVLAGNTIATATQQQPPEARDIGLVFQDFALFPHLNLLDNIAFGLPHLPKAERLARARDMLTKVGLAERATALPQELSGGQQQRVALARALAPQPRLLLLDEPFSNLDVRLRQQLREQTLQLLKSLGISSIMVTHDAEEAMYMADRIALMNNGAIVQSDTPEAIYLHPASPFAAEFFGDINRLNAQVKNGTIATVFGALPTTLAEGSHAQLLIRPEALQLTEAGATGAQPVQLLEAHHLGVNARATIRLNWQGESIPLRMLLPNTQLTTLSETPWVRIDTQGVFIFASSNP